MTQTLCPCCGNENKHLLFQVRSIPVMANRLYRSKKEAKAVRRGDITLDRCDACGTVWNCDYHFEELSYDGEYDNSQDLGQEYQAHFEQMIDFLSSNVELKGKKVLEVGCGKGRFLTALAKKTDCVACGIDPSYLGEENSADGLCVFIKKAYDKAQAQALGEGAFDCVIMRSVFEQLSKPDEMMRNVAFNLREGGYLYVEGLEFQRLLDRRSILDLSYERYTYFTFESLKRFMSYAGIGQSSSATGFKGQYMAVLGKKSVDAAAPLTQAGQSGGLEEPWLTDRDLARSRERLEEMSRRGKIALWGAANRGVMFCNLLDREETLIDCVVDILPQKQGGFLPGSGHPIVAPGEVKARDIQWVIVANENYEAEIKKQLQDVGGGAVVITAEEILRAGAA